MIIAEKQTRKTRTLSEQARASRTLRRLESAQDLMSRIGINPLNEIARLAIKAEKQGEIKTAVSAWATIQEYLAPKYKAVDPAEQIERAAKAANLAELQAIKQAILAGTAQDIQYIEHETDDFISSALSQ